MYMIVIYLKIKIDDNLLYECPSCSCIYMHGKNLFSVLTFTHACRDYITVYVF